MNSFYAFYLSTNNAKSIQFEYVVKNVDGILIMHKQKGSLFRTLFSAGVVLEFA